MSDDDEISEDDAIHQHLLFNKFFADLEEMDSKRVDDFNEMMDTSVIYLVNVSGTK